MYGVPSGKSSARWAQLPEFRSFGVYDLPKAAGAIAAGAVVYLDDALGVIKGASAAGLYRIGAATEAAADAPTARVRLDGISVVAVAA